MQLGFSVRLKKYSGILLVGFVVGFAAGQMIGPNFVKPSATIYYQKSLQGKVYIDSLPQPDGSCSPYPDNDPALESVIVTDGKTLGYPLGLTDFFDSDLQPEDGLCSYGDEFPISISPTGVYELVFSENFNSYSEDVPIFEGKPEPNIFLFGADSSIAPTWFRWLLTTVSCPNNKNICVRPVEP